MSIVSIDRKSAHKLSFQNRKVIEKSKLAGCFHCIEVFEIVDIKEWTDNDQTALCPLCGIDSVIGDASGASLNKKFLQDMAKQYFGYEP